MKYGATESLPTRVSGYAHRSPKKRGRQSGPERRDACFFTHLFYNRRRVSVCVHYPSRFSVYYYRFFERPTDKRTSLVNTFRKHSNSRDYARTIDGGQEPCPVSRLIENSNRIPDVATTRARFAPSTVGLSVRGWIVRDVL